VILLWQCHQPPFVMYTKTFTITLVSLVLLLFGSVVARAQTYGRCDAVSAYVYAYATANNSLFREESFSLTVGRNVTISYGFDSEMGAKGSTSVCLYNGNGSQTSFGCQGGLTGSGSTVLFLPAGSYRITAGAVSVNPPDDGGPDMVSGWIQVTAAKLTPAKFTVTGGGTGCDGGNATFPIGLNGSESGVTYQLYRNNVPVATVVGTGGAISFGSFKTPGVYTVATIAPCVVVSMNGSAIITDPRPANFSAWNNGPKCEANPAPIVILSATSIPGATYYWTGPYGAHQITTTSTTTINGLVGSFDYTVYASINGCVTAIATTTVTLYPAPPPTYAGANQSLCALTTTLTANPLSTGFTGQWEQVSGPASAQTQFQDRNAAITTASVTTPGTYTYRWSVSGNAVCAPSTAQVSVTYNLLPALRTVTVSSAGPRCSTDPQIIIGLANSQTGVNYQLKQNGDDIGAPLAGTGSTLTWADQGSGTYTVQAIGTGACTTLMTGEHTLTVNPAPNVYTLGGGGAVCSGTPYAITLSGSDPGVEYVLRRGTTVVNTLTGTGASLSWGNQVLPGTFTLMATNTATGCTRSMGTTTVTLNAMPSLYSVSGGGERCDDQPGLAVSLNGSQAPQGSNIVTYHLKRNNVDAGTPVTGTGSALSWGGLTEAGTYTVQAIHSNGCTRTMTSSVVITTKAAPTLANAGPDLNVCGLAVELTGNTPTVGNGVWTQISGPSQSTFNNAGAPNALVTVTTPNTYEYAWTITNSNGCTSTDYVRIIFNAVVTPANAGPDQILCDDDFAIMSANTPLAGNGEWTLVSGPDGAVFFPDANTPDALLFAPEDGTYVCRWTITNQPCTPSIDDVQITFGAGCRKSANNIAKREQQVAALTEVSANDVQVYPVPATQSLTVEIPFNGTWKAELRSMNGALVKTITSNEKASTLDVSDVPMGLYVLYIQSNGTRVVRKVEVIR